jgi:hypothetical protein
MTTTIISFFFSGIIGVVSGEGLEKINSCVDIIKKMEE